LTAKEHGIHKLGYNLNNDLPIHRYFKNLKSGVFLAPMNLANSFSDEHIFLADPWSGCNNSGPDGVIKLWKALSNAVLSNNRVSKPKVVLRILVAAIKTKNINIALSLFRVGLLSLFNRLHYSISFDIFLGNLYKILIKATKAKGGSIFLNAAAHIQHHSFFNTEYYKKNKVDNDQLLNCLKAYDIILQNFDTQFDRKNLLILTGLGQEPNPKSDEYYYQLINPAKFFDELNINYLNIRVMMARDLEIIFPSVDAAKKAFQKIKCVKFSLSKIPIFKVRPGETDQSLFIFVDIPFKINPSEQIVIDQEFLGNVKNILIFLAKKNGVHVPQGWYWYQSKNSLRTKHIANILPSYQSERLN